MPTCSICSRNSELRDVLIEGSIIQVCDNCSKYGNVIEVKPKIIERKIIKLRVEEENELIVPDYFEKIKNAREKLNMRQEELAAKINEKSSLIHSIETGHLVPTMAIAKKLENILSIKLIDYYKIDSAQSKIDFGNNSMKIGDLLKLKKD
ncbi:MAG: TIGR00270 family protein [Nanoarchaeota archaeon]|nr:TIGR00270 family protein [Nanoarchaeota archaeon]MBU0962899.1 TIGR00270 family protein [Nanoarchaeota archaeon]